MLSRWKLYRENIYVFIVIVGMFLFPIILCIVEYKK